MNVLLLNAGSSSLKAILTEASDGKVVARGTAEWAGDTTRYEFEGDDGATHSDEVSWSGHAAAVRRFVDDLRHITPAARSGVATITAVGHRIVHGGPFTTSVRITPELRSQIESLADVVAPLHNRPSLEALAAAEAELPHIPHVAVFDTSFHATLPPAAYTYPVPEKWLQDYGIRRYGFHGLSHAYCSRRAAEMLGSAYSEPRIVVCHLGHGCSASAVHSTRCIDTTMGFTPLEGLMMATRSGSIDPGIILHLEQNLGFTAERIAGVLNRESGLLGVSGVSADMRDVLAAANQGHERARLAVAIYTHRVRQAVGALAVTLGGIDALVFTAGVGEHAAEIREAICAGLECLGLRLDKVANQHAKPDIDVASESSQGRVFVISTREDVTMLREVIQVLNHPFVMDSPS